VPGRAGRTKRPGLRLHRPRTLLPVEVTKRDGIRVTTPARTILDLAAVSHVRLERLLDQAEVLELTDYPALDTIAQAHPGHPGAARLRRLLGEYEAGATLKRSDLERLFLTICKAAELPEPSVNHPVGAKEVDFLFAEQRLIVELDSWRYHKTRHAFDADRARDALHLRRGYRTLRVTDRQLEHDQHAVVATLRALLARG
jgi:very-short-patch-repair endonuclease